MSQEIYRRLAGMIETATTRVKIVVPSNDYYAGPNDYCEDTIYVIDSNHLISLLDEAAREAEKASEPRRGE